MNNFIGIDLGTTNSVICSYNGKEARIWKSPEQNDVTPSAIYFDRRGRKQIGQSAYDVAPIYPSSCAMLFKRRMGEDTPIELSSANLTVTPEECSAGNIESIVRLPARGNQKFLRNKYCGYRSSGI